MYFSGFNLIFVAILFLYVECNSENELGPFHLTQFSIDENDIRGYYEADSLKGAYTARSTRQYTYLNRWYSDTLRASSSSYGSVTLKSLGADIEGNLVLAAKLESSYINLGNNNFRINNQTSCKLTGIIAVLDPGLSVKWGHTLCSVYVGKAVASNGGVIFAGSLYEDNIWKPYIAKYDASGLVWKHKGTVSGYSPSLAVGPDGTCYWLGHYDGGLFQIANSDEWSLDKQKSLFLARIDGSGRIMWLKSYGSIGEKRSAFDVVVDNFHNIAVISNSSRLTIERIHKNGTIKASHYFPGDIRNAFGAMDGYNQLFVVGTMLTWPHHDSFRQKVFVLQFDGNELQSEQILGSDSSNIINNGISYTNGKLIIFGEFYDVGSLSIGGTSARSGLGAYALYSRVLCPLHFQAFSSNLCEPCPEGTFTLDGTRDTCSCNEGYECGDILQCTTSYGLYDNKCISCPSGTYKSIGGNSTCQQCPSNSACMGSGFICEPGYTLNGSTCAKCAANFMKPNYGNEPCVMCTENSLCDGKYSKCKAGYEPRGEECQQCQASKYKATNDNSSCIECPTGAICEKYRYTCAKGYYLNGYNQCKECELGKFKAQSGNSSCTSCPLNSYCQSTGFECGEGYEFKENKCEACTSGTFKPQAGNGMCLQCPEGAICDGSSFKCDKGFELISQECVQCSPGSYKLESGNFGCLSCPDNSICNPEGFLCKAGFGINGEMCEKCTDSYKTNTGNYACTSCPEGAICSAAEVTCQAGYEPDGSNGCKKCPSNTYKLDQGNHQCLACPKDAECTSNSIVCSSGYEPSGNTCRSCLAGYIKLNSGNTSCYECPSGGYCINSKSFTCDKGFYLSGFNCIQCAAGTYKYAIGNSTCVKCPLNSKCMADGYQCSKGYEPSGSECAKCGENSYKNVDGNFNCFSCPEGATCTESSFTCNAHYEIINGNSCKPCEKNYIKLEAGNDKCTDCRSGTQCYLNLNGNGSFQLCLAGFEPSGDNCVQCQPGYFKDNIGNATCQECPRNSICNSMNFTCKAGYGIGDGSKCKECTDGQTKFFDGNYQCHNCYAGQICTKDSFTCDAGYEPDPSEGSRCRPCVDGKFKLKAGNDKCLVCPNNAVCDHKSIRCNEGFILMDNSCMSPPNQNDESEKSDSTSSQPAGEAVNSFGSVAVLASVGAILGLTLIFAGVIIGSRRVKRSDSIDILSPPRKNPIAEIFGTITNYKPLNETLSRSLGVLTTTIAQNSEMSIPVFLKMMMRSDFDLGDLVGDGGFGKIYDCNIYSNELLYRANDSELVFKYVKNSVDSFNEVEQKLFYQEIAVMWKLRSSDQFVHINGFCEQPAGLLMKKYIAGDLENLIYGKTDLCLRFPYTKYQMVDLMSQISKGVKFMHDNNIVHCDLKPSNIFLDVDKTRTKLVAVIADFGLCRVVDPASVEVSAFRIADFNGGSLLYAAPEAISRIRTRQREYNGAIIMASDTYSLVLTMMEMITKKRPWF